MFSSGEQLSIDDLKSISASSDAGGIAARNGFRFQDHVAARLTIEMLDDPNILQVECETADDIVLRRKENGKAVIEYIQVKTTEKDSKWTKSELTRRVKGKIGSSICEKSLLCDKHGEIAWFRFVSTRAIAKQLKPFQENRSKRTNCSDLEELASRFSEKFSTVQSASRRTVYDWAKNMLWEVDGDEETLSERNTSTLLKLSNKRGIYPDFKVIKGVYSLLTDKVRSMGDKPSVDNDQKVWKREDCLKWWESQLDKMQKTGTGAIKVYQIRNLPKFFSEICSINEEDIKRALYAYDVEFDGDIWRKSELIVHLLKWLPEIALEPKTLANFNYLEAKKITSDALKQLDQRGFTDMQQLIASLMLNAILRYHFKAEPIACRIFFLVKGKMRASSAHIVHLPTGEEIWLGRSRLVTASTHEAVVNEVISEMRTSLTNDVLNEERDIIIQLREPQHLRDDKLGAILSETGKTSEFSKILHFPILVAYDSTILGSGFTVDYLAKLKEEVEKEYSRIKALLVDDLTTVKISIFLIPVLCADTLAKDFEKELRK